MQSKELRTKQHSKSFRNNSKQSEVHIGFACCNLRRRKLAVADGNKLVEVSERVEGLRVPASPHPTTHVHNSPRHGCAQCVKLTTLALAKPQVSRRQFVAEARAASRGAAAGGDNSSADRSMRRSTAVDGCRMEFWQFAGNSRRLDWRGR